LNFFFKNLDETEWVVSRERYKFDEMFQELQPVDGKITSLFLNFYFLIIKETFQIIFKFSVLG